MARVSGAFEKSTEVMKAMQSLVKVSEVRNNMMELSKEMMKVCLRVAVWLQKSNGLT